MQLQITGVLICRDQAVGSPQGHLWQDLHLQHWQQQQLPKGQHNRRACSRTASSSSSKPPAAVEQHQRNSSCRRNSNVSSSKTLSRSSKISRRPTLGKALLTTQLPSADHTWSSKRGFSSSSSLLWLAPVCCLQTRRCRQKFCSTQQWCLAAVSKRCCSHSTNRSSNGAGSSPSSSGRVQAVQQQLYRSTGSSSGSMASSQCNIQPCKFMPSEQALALL